MSSRRALKKRINDLTFELISECYVYKHFHKGKKEKTVDGILEEIAHKRNELIHKINNPGESNESKKNKQFYSEIVDGMKDMVTSMDKLGGK